MVSEDTVIGLVVPVAVRVVPAPVQETMYPVMVAPPFEAGAANVIVAAALPALTETPVGALGTVVVGVEGVTGAVTVAVAPPPPPPQETRKTVQTQSITADEELDRLIPTQLTS